MSEDCGAAGYHPPGLLVESPISLPTPSLAAGIPNPTTVSTTFSAALPVSPFPPLYYSTQSTLRLHFDHVRHQVFTRVRQRGSVWRRGAPRGLSSPSEPKMITSNPPTHQEMPSSAHRTNPTRAFRARTYLQGNVTHLTPCSSQEFCEGLTTAGARDPDLPGPSACLRAEGWERTRWLRLDGLNLIMFVHAPRKCI